MKLCCKRARSFKYVQCALQINYRFLKGCEESGEVDEL